MIDPTVPQRSLPPDRDRSDRLFEIIRILQDGRRHRGQDLAGRLGVSVRTIYRDMEKLMAAGLPIEGERGLGYRASKAITLPPLRLSNAELEALNLGVAIVGEAADPELRAAALSLADKIDAALPSQVVAEAWKVALSPFADAARGFSHIATLRAAIRSRQKLRLVYRRTEGTPTDRQVRPLRLEAWGSIWTLTAWCEMRQDFRDFRVDLIESATALPELFVDEPGKALADRPAR
jgi:predicted DNA-binding transcriptional regulator YafY